MPVGPCEYNNSPTAAANPRMPKSTSNQQLTPNGSIVTVLEPTSRNQHPSITPIGSLADNSVPKLIADSLIAQEAFTTIELFSASFRVSATSTVYQIYRSRQNTGGLASRLIHIDRQSPSNTNTSPILAAIAMIARDTPGHSLVPTPPRSENRQEATKQDVSSAKDTQSTRPRRPAASVEAADQSEAVSIGICARLAEVASARRLLLLLA